MSVISTRHQTPKLTGTAELYDLLIIPAAHRNSRWRESFLRAAIDASVELPFQIVYGDLNTPQFRVNLPRPEASFDAYSVAGFIDICIERGLGIAFYLNADEPTEEINETISFGELLALSRSIFGPARDHASIDTRTVAAILKHFTVKYPSISIWISDQRYIQSEQRLHVTFEIAQADGPIDIELGDTCRRVLQWYLPPATVSRIIYNGQAGRLLSEFA